MATAAAAPLAGAMVGAARPSDDVLVTDSSEAEAVDPAEVAVAVPAVVLEDSSSSSSSSELAELGSWVPQSALILVLHSFCPLALPVFCAIQSEYSCSQMKVGTVCV
jgi:hypothetical protein